MKAQPRHVRRVDGGVVRLAQKANARTRSQGVAFSGCTLPGASEPMFAVPSQRMAIGLGLHGKPGLSEAQIVPANELATLRVERLLAARTAEVDPTQQWVVALLNGLGNFTYKALFVLFGAVAEELRSVWLVRANCECGELVTSPDMAGVSLSLCWLDEELEPLWMAEADSPAFRRGVFEPHPDGQLVGRTSGLRHHKRRQTQAQAEATLGSSSCWSGCAPWNKN